MKEKDKEKVIEIAKGRTPDCVDVVIEEVKNCLDDDCKRFFDPTFEIKHSSYVWRLGEAHLLILDMIDNYNDVCLNDVKIALRYLFVVIAARFDVKINIIEARKEFRIAGLRKKYPWK